MEQRKTMNPVKLVIGLLAIAVIGVGILGIRDSYSANTDSKKIIRTDSSSNVEVDKIEANKELNKLYYALIGALETGEEVQNRTGKGELLATPMERFQFAYFASYYNGDPNQSILDTNSMGYGVTGAYAVKLDYFKQYYRDLLNEEFDVSVLEGQSSYVVMNDYIYGSIMSGLSFSNTTLKIKSFNEKDGKYYLLIDCLVSDEDEYVNYAGDSVTEYPDEIVTYNLKLILKKNGNLYSIESMVAY